MGVLEALEVETVVEELADVILEETLELDWDEALVVLVLVAEIVPELLLTAEVTSYKSNRPDPPQNSVAFAEHTISQSERVAMAPPLEIVLPQSAQRG